MASILDRYGIKEVADLTFYAIEDNGTPGAPSLYIDTAKVSTIEQTAETVYAQGGKGNARLIGWDFGKEITLNIEDALFSAKSMAVMFGNGTVNSTASNLMRTVTFTATSASGSGVPTTWEGPKGSIAIDSSGAAIYDENGASVTAASLTAGSKYFYTFFVAPTAYKEIVVGPNTFPGTYYITGDTYARSEITGEDEFFQFVVPKGKITSENTITLEAEGDPSVFQMNVDVLRATENGKHVMMKLIQYSVDTTPEDDTD